LDAATECISVDLNACPLEYLYRPSVILTEVL